MKRISSEDRAYIRSQARKHKIAGIRFIGFARWMIRVINAGD